jgi:AcrR family transcriptional regulator
MYRRMNKGLMTPVPERASGQGLRERNKRERMRRIKEAAFEVFRQVGFDAASTRDIAERADVSIGTLFIYARDKHDLLCLVLNEDLDQILTDAINAVPSEGLASTRIIALLHPIYAYFAREPELARAIDREVATFDLRDASSGEQSRRFYARMDRWYGAVEHIITTAEQQNLITIGKDAGLLARILFDIHLAEVRRCLRDDSPDFPAALIETGKIIRLILGDRERDIVRRPVLSCAAAPAPRPRSSRRRTAG